MGKSQETFSKKEKQKKKLKQRQDKAEKMEERKANAKKGRTLDEMLAYVDENGNLSSTPPDVRRKKTINPSDIELSIQRKEAPSSQRTGVVTFFNQDKGYGFIKDLQTQEDVFVHANQLSVSLKEQDRVGFEVEMGHKGPQAVHVTKTA